MNKKFIILFVILALSLTGCLNNLIPGGDSDEPVVDEKEPKEPVTVVDKIEGEDDEEEEEEVEEVFVADDSQLTKDGVKKVAEANNKFTFDFYSKFSDRGGNIFFSPFSISSALAMTHEGAKGKTAEEMESVFYFPQSNSERRPAFARIYNIVNKKDKKYKLQTANALWAQEDYPFLESYLGIIEKYYGGRTTNLDFVKETEKSRIVINDWVEKKTYDKIKDLIPAGVLNPLTRLVLTNAVYFKGNWATQFDEKNTREEDFKTGVESTIKVPMMSMTGDEVKFSYTETDKLQALELPYEDEELSMLILLPKGDNLSSVEASLSLEELTKLREGLQKKGVDVYLPRFKFETKYSLKNTLETMGMPTAFSLVADFSGMDGTKGLLISEVIHQAFVKVNEEGTEAAAATAVVMELKSVPAPNIVFRADHPFIFFIIEKETDSILFMGRMANPNQ